MLDSQSSDPGFESCSDHYLNLFLGSPEFKSSATLVNSQLVCLQPIGILNNVMFNLNYLFPLFQWCACKLATLSACIAKCMTTINKIYIFFYITMCQTSFRFIKKMVWEKDQTSGKCNFVYKDLFYEPEVCLTHGNVKKKNVDLTCSGHALSHTNTKLS